MPRIRGVKPETFLDEDLAILPLWVRYFFVGLWCYADKDGCAEDRPRYFKTVLFPYDDCDAEAALAMLADPKIPGRPGKVFIRRYEYQGKRYFDIPSWQKHQRPHHTEKKSVIPSFEEVQEDLTGKTTLPNGETTLSNVKNQEESVNGVCSLSMEKESVSGEGEGEGEGVRGRGNKKKQNLGAAAKPSTPSSLPECTDKAQSEKQRRAELRAQMEQLKRMGVFGKGNGVGKGKI